MKRIFEVVCMSAIVTALGTAASAVDIVTVPVGDVGNIADSTGFGAVDYEYNIGKYEVTAGQYTEFLNAVAKTDTYGLYADGMAHPTWASVRGCNILRDGIPGSYTYSIASDWANRPVNYVSWGDAARFVNWLHNGQPTGVQNLSTTEDGSYYLNGAITDAALIPITRKPEALWAIPTDDEWYKAAYHDGDTGRYFIYPAGSDSHPQGTYDGDVTGFPSPPYFCSEVGAYEDSASPHGTFDQGGNVAEWNGTLLYGARYRTRGGYFGSTHDVLRKYHKYYISSPTYESMTVGFRVASIPEPATLTLLTLGGLAIIKRRR